MYDIRQFKPTLYFLLLMGVSGFAMAAQSPGIWILAAGGIMVNAWLVKTRRFVPMPHLLANIVTLASLAFVAFQIHYGDTTPILTIGKFLVLLHLVKLYELRANRDYAQLLVLSLLLMVAASISTASLLFGLTLIVYLFISLFCCLLFHLKVEADHAKATFGQPEDANPSTLRQDQRDLSRSMRRLTGLVSSVSVVMAVLVFLFFPRGAGEGMFGQLQFRPSQTLTGFSDQVSFQKIAQITRNEDVVARVQIYKDNKKLDPLAPILLRGTALDVYSGNDARRGGQWLWSRSQALVGEEELFILGPDDHETFGRGTGAYRQEITLQPTGTSALFALAGATDFVANREMRIRFSQRDQTLQTADPLDTPVQYTVYSNGELPPENPGETSQNWRSSVIDPHIAAYARRPEVCGVDASARPLSSYPTASRPNHSFDSQIARNIENHLRTEFSYTLDLTDAKRIDPNGDPIVAFLYDFKKGHCEYFAGAMALMCQSLNIPARLVVGFRCDAEDYNNVLGGYYVVKQSNAHAWCEVFTGSKWETFDPTSGREAEAGHKAESFAAVKNFFDFLEYKWANSVVAYDRGDCKNLVDTMNYQMSCTAVSGSQEMSNRMRKLAEWWDNGWRYTFSTGVLATIMVAMVLVLLFAVGWFMWERLRLSKRARRIGLEMLPASAKQRLVRQLGFYDDLLRILERHRIIRPRHLTPLEFSETLSFLPSDVYDDIHRLTSIFYRIRYGSSYLNVHRRRRLAVIIARVQQAMDTANIPSSVTSTRS